MPRSWPSRVVCRTLMVLVAGLVFSAPAHASTITVNMTGVLNFINTAEEAPGFHAVMASLGFVWFVTPVTVSLTLNDTHPAYDPVMGVYGLSSFTFRIGDLSSTVVPHDLFFTGHLSGNILPMSFGAFAPEFFQVSPFSAGPPAGPLSSIAHTWLGTLWHAFHFTRVPGPGGGSGQLHMGLTVTSVSVRELDSLTFLIGGLVVCALLAYRRSHSPSHHKRLRPPAGHSRDVIDHR